MDLLIIFFTQHPTEIVQNGFDMSKISMVSPTYDSVRRDLHDKNVINSLQRYHAKIRIRLGHVNSWIHA
jgi:hypothetical protein